MKVVGVILRASSTWFSQTTSRSMPASTQAWISVASLGLHMLRRFPLPFNACKSATV